MRRWIEWDPRVGRIWIDEDPVGPPFARLDAGPGIEHVLLAEWPMSGQVPPQAVYEGEGGRPWSRITHDFDHHGTPVCRCEIISPGHAIAMLWYQSMSSGEPPVEPGLWSAHPNGLDRLMWTRPSDRKPSRSYWEYSD